MWRNHQATTLATPEAFEQDPGLVWLFYSYRRHKALQAKPNSGHYALTELSKKMPEFITLTQNVDGKVFPSSYGITRHVMLTSPRPPFYLLINQNRTLMFLPDYEFD